MLAQGFNQSSNAEGKCELTFDEMDDEHESSLLLKGSRTLYRLCKHWQSCVDDTSCLVVTESDELAVIFTSRRS